MKQHFSLLAAFSTALAAAAASAQQTPHTGYVFPAGGQQGATFEVRVGGQYLDGVSAAHISGRGVSAKVVQLIKPMNQQQANQLRERLTALMQKKNPGAAAQNPGAKTPPKPGEKPAAKPGEKPAAKAGEKPSKPAAKPGGNPAGPAAVPVRPIILSDAEEKEILDIRKTLAKFYARTTVPAIAETVVLQVIVANDAMPGTRELRLETPTGLTNPLVFQIGTLAEVVNRQVDDDSSPGKGPLRQVVAQNPPLPPEKPTLDIQLPTVVNGQILSGQVDRYRFAAKKGQHLVIAVSAQQLVPYIADAVPGWFQAAISLRDEHGEELAAADSFRFHPDPLLHFDVPRDGAYLVEIHDSIFRGREDFVYRMAVGELPYATDVFPLGAKSGATTEVKLQGWNLPAHAIAVFDPQKAAEAAGGRAAVGGHRQQKLWNDLPFARDALPECFEQEPNDSSEQAQKVSLPIIVNGRIDRPGDRDVFSFQGKAGQEIVAEVYARRLGSPVDSALKLTDASGKQLAFNDDHEDPSCGLLTHHADSWLTAKLPAAGTYYLHLYDTQNQGGPEYAYRLRISPPRPDFDLRIVPSSVNVRAGGTTAITVRALRREGCNGPIQLQLDDAPAGFRLSGATILAGQDRVRCTLSVPTELAEEPVALKMYGRATIDGREALREAVPADDMMQAFYYHHLVPAQEWMVATTGRGGVPLRLANLPAVKLPIGGSTVLHFLGPHGPVIQTVQFKLSEPPDGLAIQKTVFTDVGMDVTLRADAKKLKPGWKGNVILEAAVMRQPEPRPNQPNPPLRRVVLGVLPAAPVEVVAK
jgi:hypothetical protein